MVRCTIQIELSRERYKNTNNQAMSTPPDIKKFHKHIANILEDNKHLELNNEVTEELRKILTAHANINKLSVHQRAIYFLFSAYYHPVLDVGVFSIFPLLSI